MEMYERSVLKIKSIFLILFILCGIVSLNAQLKDIETTYLQLPTEGIKYEKVDVYITLDQSESRDVLSKFGSIGKKAASKVADVTEVYDTWKLVPFFIKTDNVGKGTLRMDVTYKPDDLRKPLAAPPVNRQRGGHVVPYRVFAKIKVADPSGKVIYDRDYGVMSGEFVSPNYEEANVAKDGVGTYEKACVRGAMAKARAEFYGRYGFGTIDAKLDLGAVKDIKETDKAFGSVMSIFKGRKSFGLTNKEKETVKSFVNMIETNLTKCSDKTRWVAYHDLAVCYAWLENATKAKEYLDKEYAENKVSIDKVIARKSFNGGDQEKHEAYSNIEEFVKYYPTASTKYHNLLVALSRPLKQLVDFYANNDLISQIYGLDYMYDFFPFQKYNANPKKVTITIKQGEQAPIVAKQEFDKSGKVEVVRVAGKSDDGKDVETKKLVVSYYDDGSYWNITAKTLFTQEINSLRYFRDPLDKATRGLADGILDDGWLGASNENLVLRFDMQGIMYIAGNSYFTNPDPIIKRFVSDQNFKFNQCKTKTEFSAQTSINEAGVIDLSDWNGTIDVSWGLSGSDYIKANVNRKHKVAKLTDKNYPVSMNYNYSSNAKFKSEKINWKGLGQRFTSYDNAFNDKISAPKVSANNFELQKSQNWPCTYTFDDKGNWTTAKIGSTTITREIKY